MNQTLHLALCFELPSSNEPNGNVPEWVQLIPAGATQGSDKRRFINSNPQQILDAKLASNRHIPLDIEHATEIKGPIGEAAPAQGWFEQLEIRNGEVWGKLNANEDGQALLSKQNYRYISPAFYHDANGHITAISSVGLTNKPNLDLVALNHQQHSPHSQQPQSEQLPMKLPLAIATALSLNSETATEADAVTAIKKLQSDHELALNRSAQVDLGKFVPMDTHNVALNRAETAEASLNAIQEEKTESLVDAAIDAGKVAPKDKAMYLALCHSQAGREQFESFVKSAPSIVSDKQTKTPKNEGETVLEEHELAMCRSLQISEVDFIQQKTALK